MDRKSLVLIFIACMTVSCSSRREDSQAREATIPVRIGGVRRIHTAQTVAVSGSVVPWKDPSNVAFVVAGKVVEASPREGDPVQKGQLLAKIDRAAGNCWESNQQTSCFFVNGDKSLWLLAPDMTTLNAVSMQYPEFQ